MAAGFVGLHDLQPLGEVEGEARRRGLADRRACVLAQHDETRARRAGPAFLRRRDQHVDAERAQFREFGAEVGGLRALHLDAVDPQELPSLARRQRQPVGMLDAAEAALVLRHVQRARGEAARRVRQRQPAPGDDFQFRHVAATGQQPLAQFGDELAALLDAGHPAPQAVLEQHRQGAVVVDVQAGAGDEGQAALAAKLHGGQVVGFDQETAVLEHARHRIELGLGLDQGQARQHDLLAGRGQLDREGDPVAGAQFAPLAAHGFAQVDDVDRPGIRLPVEGERGVARPEVRQRA